jgi:hypothetical protein
MRSVLAAVYSHFGPGKFPANWGTVAACVAVYCALNAILTAFCYVKERDSFLVTLPKLVRGSSSGFLCVEPDGRAAVGAHTHHLLQRTNKNNNATHPPPNPPRTN